MGAGPGSEEGSASESEYIEWTTPAKRQYRREHGGTREDYQEKRVANAKNAARRIRKKVAAATNAVEAELDRKELELRGLKGKSLSTTDNKKRLTAEVRELKDKLRSLPKPASIKWELRAKNMPEAKSQQIGYQRAIARARRGKDAPAPDKEAFKRATENTQGKKAKLDGKRKRDYKRDLTREGVEKNPGPPKPETVPPVVPHRQTASSKNAARRQGKRAPGAVEALSEQIVDMTAQVRAQQDVAAEKIEAEREQQRIDAEIEAERKQAEHKDKLVRSFANRELTWLSLKHNAMSVAPDTRDHTWAMYTVAALLMIVPWLFVTWTAVLGLYWAERAGVEAWILAPLAWALEVPTTIIAVMLSTCVILFLLTWLYGLARRGHDRHRVTFRALELDEPELDVRRAALTHVKRKYDPVYMEMTWTTVPTDFFGNDLSVAQPAWLPWVARALYAARRLWKAYNGNWGPLLVWAGCTWLETYGQGWGLAWVTVPMSLAWLAWRLAHATSFVPPLIWLLISLGGRLPVWDFMLTHLDRRPAVTKLRVSAELIANVYSPGYSADREELQRMGREMRAMAAINVDRAMMDNVVENNTHAIMAFMMDSLYQARLIRRATDFAGGAVLGLAPPRSY